MKVLIDTTFLLPALGLDVGGEVTDIIKRFERHDIYFTELSLLEAMWVIRRIERRGERVDFKLVSTGLKSILSTYKLVKIPRTAYVKAVRDKRHNDLIDLILYYTALVYRMKFLTLDTKLREIDDKGTLIHSL